MSKQYFGPIGQNQYLEYAGDIQFSGTHLLSLINDILDLSKVEADKFELHKQEIDVTSAVYAALRIVRSRALEAGLEIKVDLPVSLPGLFADERALKQILINLLSNAIKFTPKGGRVTVTAETDGDGSLVLIVADTGIGIAKEDIEKVMKPFTQVDAALARKYEGTGLGLSLTTSLVELHGGTLELDSQLGCGTKVRVSFGKGSVILSSSTVGLLKWLRSAAEEGASKVSRDHTLAEIAPAKPVRKTRIIELTAERCRT
jgi:signal transduction histidine kinase